MKKKDTRVPSIPVVKMEKQKWNPKTAFPQNIRRTQRIRGQRVDFYGTPLNRARLNGQSNDKCISYATMSPAPIHKNRK